MKKSAVLNSQSRRYAHVLIDEAPDGYWVTVRPATRSLEQNSRMWAMLTDISQQVVWHGQKLAPEDWKHIFSAAMKAQRAVPGIEGGFVVLGQSTSSMGKAEMSEMQTLMEAFGAEHNVIFKEQV